MKSSWFRSCLPFSLFIALTVTAFQAAASDDLDVTMTMVTDDEALTDTVVREIRLSTPINVRKGPVNASDNASDTAREAREFGRSVAEKAKEEAREKIGGASPGKPELPEPEAPQSRPGSPDSRLK